jgi:hypothetical protein
VRGPSGPLNSMRMARDCRASQAGKKTTEVAAREASRGVAQYTTTTNIGTLAQRIEKSVQAMKSAEMASAASK